MKSNLQIMQNAVLEVTNLNLLVPTKFHWSWVRVAVLIAKTKNVVYQFLLYSSKNTK